MVLSSGVLRSSTYASGLGPNLQDSPAWLWWRRRVVQFSELIPDFAMIGPQGLKRTDKQVIFFYFSYKLSL